MKRIGIILGAVVGLAVLFRFLPLFHVVSLKRAQEEKAAAIINPGQFAARFWEHRILESLDSAINASVLLPAIQKDPQDARKKYSRSLGISESYTYFIAGEGRIVKVSDDEIALAVTPNATTPEIAIQTGLVFGNAIRDGTGLLNVNDYPNSQDFNAISEALNHIVETNVLPQLRKEAKTGSTMRFVGCAEVNDESSDLKPLKLVPIKAALR